MSMSFDQIMDCYPGTKSRLGNQKCFESLLIQMQRNNVVPFVGAGMSADFYPLWSRFIRDLAADLGPTLKSEVESYLMDASYEKAISLLEKKIGRPGFLGLVRETFDRDKIDTRKFSPALQAFQKLFQGLILTTNIDHVLERLYTSQGITYTALSVHNASSPDIANDSRLAERRHLFKLHGDYDIESSWVLTKEQYDCHYGNPEQETGLPLPKLLRGIIESNCMLFLGSSLGTDRTTDILKHMASRRDTPHYAILPLHDKTKNEREPQHPFLTDAEGEPWPEQDNYQETLAELNLHVIWYPAHEHQSVGIILEELVKRLGRNGLGGAVDPLFLPQVNWQEQKRNPAFTGRTYQLESIHKFFHYPDSRYDKLVIAGLGGMGKTQIAREYAYRNSDAYDVIVWINCGSSQTARKSFVDIAENLKLDTSLGDKNLVRDLNEWFTRQQSILVIYDNLDTEDDDVSSVLHPFEPYHIITGNGHVLITSRNRKLGLHRCKVFDIHPLTTEESRAFMRERLSDAMGAIDTIEALDNVIELLGRLPLALEQAAAYMSDSDMYCSCTEFLRLLKDNGLTVFEAESAQPSDYNNVLTVTWNMTFSRLRDEARQMLFLCSYMAPDTIPLSFFTRHGEMFPSPLCEVLKSTFRTNEVVIRPLAKYALITRQGNRLSIHRLVQGVTRGNAESDEISWLELCFKAMEQENDETPELNNQLYREHFRQIASHIPLVIDHSIKKRSDNFAWLERLARFCVDSVIKYEWVALYSQAIELCDLIRRLYEYKHAIVRDRIEIANLNYLYGRMYQAKGELDDAEAMYRDALDVFEEELGDHEYTSSVRSSLALLMYSRGNPECLGLYQKAMAFRKRTQDLHQGNQNVYSVHGRLAPPLEWHGKSHEVFINLQPRMGEIRDMFVQAAEMKRKEMGGNSPSLAASYSNIGIVDHAQGKFTDAREHYLKAIAIYSDHDIDAYTAIVHSNLACACYQEKLFDDALAYFAEAMAIRERVLGAQHPSTIATMQLIENVKDRKTLFNRDN